MRSQQSSFKDVFEFPREETDRKGKKKVSGNNKNKFEESTRPLNQQPTQPANKHPKHASLLARTLRNRVKSALTLDQTLSSNQLLFLENQTQEEPTNVCFQHHNKLILAFQIVFILTLLTYMWNCSFQIVLGPLIHIQAVKIMIIFMYLSHIVLFNFTEHKNQKFQLISNRNQVYKLYMNQKFLKDSLFLLMVALQISPLDNLEQSFYLISRIISIICCISQLNDTWDKIENLLSISNKAETFIKMVTLIFKIFLFLHLLSMSLNSLAIVEAHNNITETWITESGIDFNNNFQKYVVGWYWGATILSTVGFGDIVPKNNYQRFFISIIQVICCMTFGYFVNVIGGLIQLRGESKEKYQKQIRSLNRCMNFLSATNELQHKIRTHYFNRYVIQQMHNPNEEKQMLQNLTPNLQNALLQENNINILKKNPIMDKFAGPTLLKLTKILKKIIFAPEYIIYSNITKDKKLWFIEKGQIQEFTDLSKLRKMIGIYNENDSMMGWINFLTQASYKSVTRAKTFTIAYQLDEQSFTSILKQNMSEYYKFLNMRQVMIQRNIKFENRCISCQENTHNVINCPRIHFIHRDAVKMTDISFNKFFDQTAKILKYERSLKKHNWKLHFLAHDLNKQNKQGSFVLKISNQSTDNFFKEALRSSTIHHQNRRASFIMMAKKFSKVSGPQTDSKQSKEQIYQKSFIQQSDQIIEEEMEDYFEKVFFVDDESNNYMPYHNVRKVLNVYANKFSKKLQIDDKLRKLMRK